MPKVTVTDSFEPSKTRAGRSVSIPSAANRPKDSQTFLKPDGKNPGVFSFLCGRFDAIFKFQAFGNSMVKPTNSY